MSKLKTDIIFWDFEKKFAKLQQRVSSQGTGPLEPVCFTKRQKIVPDQLLVCGVGDSERPEGFQTDSILV